MQRGGDVFRILDYETDHIGAFVFLVVLSCLKYRFALLETECVVYGEVILDYLLGTVPDSSPRGCESYEFALYEVDVTHRTHVHEVFEAVELKAQRLNFVVNPFGVF